MGCGCLREVPIKLNSLGKFGCFRKVVTYMYKRLSLMGGGRFVTFERLSLKEVCLKSVVEW